MKAYILLRTKYGVSKDIVECIEKMCDGSFIQGNVIYGWYDGIVEYDVANSTKLNEFVKELRRKYSDITHIGTAIERAS